MSVIHSLVHSQRKKLSSKREACGECFKSSRTVWKEEVIEKRSTKRISDRTYSAVVDFFRRDRRRDCYSTTTIADVVQYDGLRPPDGKVLGEGRCRCQVRGSEKAAGIGDSCDRAGGLKPHDREVLMATAILIAMRPSRWMILATLVIRAVL
jgi:hypothetical protein